MIRLGAQLKLNVLKLLPSAVLHQRLGSIISSLLIIKYSVISDTACVCLETK